MTVESNARSGGRILVDCLRTHGVEIAFCVPGESYLAVLDALYDSPEIRLITCRQEGGAAIMAEAYGKLTGRPGICFVTRGPGATNASAGLHIARQDSTPMILFIGQVGRDMVEREAFQEIDYRRMLGQLTKWTAQIDDPARIPELLSRAFHQATSGRPGPVALALPEDMLREAAKVANGNPYRPVQAYPEPGAMNQLRQLLMASQRPLLLLGEADWDAEACRALERFCATNELPVAATFRCQDLFDNSHRCYVGDVGLGNSPALTERVRNADLLVALGGRLGEIPSDGYTLFEIPTPRQRLVHVHPGVDELNRVYQASLAINAGLKHFSAALDQLEPITTPSWTEATRQAREQYLGWIQPPAESDGLKLGQIMVWLRDNLSADAIVSNGAGNYTAWVHRFHQYRRFRTQLAPTSGSMGYGLPAAVAAKLLYPNREVVCFAGDGCFQMTMQELGTAIQFGANVIVLVVNNRCWGTIRMHQERRYPARAVGTELVNPDFAALAQAYGGYGAVVRRAEAFADTFREAQAAARPALIELQLDLETLTPRASLSEIRAAAQG